MLLYNLLDVGINLSRSTIFLNCQVSRLSYMLLYGDISLYYIPKLSYKTNGNENWTMKDYQMILLLDQRYPYRLK